MIISSPGIESSTQDCERIVEFVDIYPTIADLAGLTPPNEIEGVSLRPLMLEPDAQWDRPAYIQTLFVDVPGYSIRTDRWRYIEWGQQGDKGTELYDQQNDPSEMNNLAESKEHSKTINRLRELVHQNWGSKERYQSPEASSD